MTPEEITFEVAINAGLCLAWNCKKSAGPNGYCDDHDDDLVLPVLQPTIIDKSAGREVSLESQVRLLKPMKLPNVIEHLDRLRKLADAFLERDDRDALACAVEILRRIETSTKQAPAKP